MPREALADSDAGNVSAAPGFQTLTDFSALR